MPAAHTSRDLNLKPVAEKLLAHHRGYAYVPAITLAQAGFFVGKCLALMFPHFASDKNMSGPEIEARLLTLTGRLKVILCEVQADEAGLDRDHVAAAFVGALPELAASVHLDAEAFLEHDPAAGSLNEVILAYPGLKAIATYRLARKLKVLGVPQFPRLMTEYGHQSTGVEINPGACIGSHFFVDHGTGVVIGDTAVIGDHVKIYQGVTLGALRVRPEERDLKRHPTVEDNVTIYANATILGGKTVVGRDSIIGGNVWLTRSVPPNSRVMYRSVGWQGLAEPEAERSDDYVI